MSMNTTTSIAVLLVALAACIWDVRTRRIPNALTFGTALAGLLFHRLASGTDGALFAAGGWVVGLAIFLPFFVFRGMGGGDVKLLAALGAWLGPHDAFWLAIYSGIAGGVLGIAVAVSRGYLRTALRNVCGAFAYWYRAGLGPVPGLTLDSTSAPRLAYAIPIFVGAMVTLWR